MRTLLADHPLVTHKLTLLRDAGTDTATFRTLADELVTLLAYEATREVRVAEVTVTSPVGVATGAKLAQPKPLIVPVFFFSSRRRHTMLTCDWSSDVCSSDLPAARGDHGLPRGTTASRCPRPP